MRVRILEKTEITRLTVSDDLDLASAGSEKTAIFVMLPVHDTSFGLFIPRMRGGDSQGRFI